MSKTYATLPEWAAAMQRGLEMGSELIGDLPQREQLHTMRQALAAIIALEAERLPVPTVTERVTHCRSCHAPVVWRPTSRGGKVPHDVVDGVCNGINHFTTCPDAATWSKKARR
jgi:hypothetical protein